MRHLVSNLKQSTQLRSCTTRSRHNLNALLQSIISSSAVRLRVLETVSEFRVEEDKPPRLKDTKSKFVTWCLGDLVVTCFQYQLLTQTR